MNELMKLAHDVCNGKRGKEDIAEAIQAFFTDHPCVQDVAFRYILKPLVEEMGRRWKAGRYDGRNARAYRMAADMTTNAAHNAGED